MFEGCKKQFFLFRNFYLNSLQTIDAAIENRLQEIDSQVNWKEKFQVKHTIL